MAERRFSSSHHLRGDLWRPSEHLMTRELGHHLVHGQTHDPGLAKCIAALAAKARRLGQWPDCTERAEEETQHG